jgi:hypothetical protein
VRAVWYVRYSCSDLILDYIDGLTFIRRPSANTHFAWFCGWLLMITDLLFCCLRRIRVPFQNVNAGGAASKPQPGWGAVRCDGVSTRRHAGRTAGMTFFGRAGAGGRRNTGSYGRKFLLVSAVGVHAGLAIVTITST